MFANKATQGTTLRMFFIVHIAKFWTSYTILVGDFSDMCRAFQRPLHTSVYRAGSVPRANFVPPGWDSRNKAKMVRIYICIVRDYHSFVDSCYLLIKLIRILLKSVETHTGQSTLFWPLWCESEAILLKRFVLVTRVRVFIWKNCHPAGGLPKSRSQKPWSRYPGQPGRPGSYEKTFRFFYN